MKTFIVHVDGNCGLGVRTRKYRIIAETVEEAKDRAKDVFKVEHGFDGAVNHVSVKVDVAPMPCVS